MFELNRQFKKFIVFLVNTVESLNRVIANHTVFLKDWREIIGIISCFHCNSLLYVDFRHFCVNLINQFWENQCLLVNTISSLNSIIANKKDFLKNKQYINGIIGCFYFNFAHFISSHSFLSNHFITSHFCVNFIDLSWEN